jgi:hypothetical protein
VPLLGSPRWVPDLSAGECQWGGSVGGWIDGQAPMDVSDYDVVSDVSPGVPVQCTI